jgi:hypothetical protein
LAGSDVTDASDNGTSRLDRIEEALRTLVVTVQSVGSQVKHQGETTALGLQTLTEMMRVLDARMTVLDARMTEIIARLTAHLGDGHGSAA